MKSVVVQSISWLLLIYFTPGSMSPAHPDFRTNKISDIKAFENKLGNFFRNPVPNLAEHLQPFLTNFQQALGTKSVENITGKCLAHLGEWGDSSNWLKEWALKMFDAFTKVPEGILSGHVNSYGDFDECLGVRAEVNISEIQSSFKGKYCSSYIVPKDMCGGDANRNGFTRNEFGIREYQTKTLASALSVGLYPNIGICFPSTCSTLDIQAFWMILLNSINSDVCLAVDHCYTDDAPKLRIGDISMIVILSIIGVCCLVGTACDLLQQRDGGSKTEPRSIALQSIIAFSLYTNTKKWLNTNSGSDNLGCVHGIRFLSTCWVVLAHTWSTLMPKVWNMVDFLMIYKDNWTLYPILNGTVSVDTFFTLSAILVAYNVLKMLDKSKGGFNFPLFYLHRYLRLTPTYALLIGIMATWYEHLRPGPNTSQLSYSAASCRKNWWHNLLYINNVVHYGDDPNDVMCHGESWYLGNDMQFFLISPFLLIPLFKWQKIGYAVMGVFTVAAVVVPWAITYCYKLDATLLVVSPNSMEYIKKIYMKPWTRFGPYIVGLWAGFLLYKIQTSRTPIKLPKYVVLLGWLTSTLVALLIIFGPMSYFDPENKYDRIGSAFYAGFHRFAWGAVISWIVLACTMGYGGLINTFLSWKAFIPLGRLAFCTYLISLWLQTLYQLSARQSVSYDLYSTIHLFFAHMVMSLLLSFIACMTLESPFIALEKLFFQQALPEPKPVDREPFENSDNSNNNTQA